MKKVILIVTLFVSLFLGNLYAQSGARPAFGDITGYGPSDFVSVNHTKNDGSNTVKLTNGRGIVKFDARGDKFSNVMFTDASGKTVRLVPQSGGTAGAPKTDCKYPIPDACFATADKKVGLCMCRPTNLSAGGSGDPNAILIGLLLPAVQKIREAANR